MAKTLITKKALQCQINEEIQRKNPSRNRRRLNENTQTVRIYEELLNFIKNQKSTIGNTLSKYGFDPNFEFVYNYDYMDYKFGYEIGEDVPCIDLIPTNKHIKDNFEDITLCMNFITDLNKMTEDSDLSNVRVELYVDYKPYGSNEYKLENTNKYQCTVPEIPKIISLLLRDLNKRLILVGKSQDSFNQGDFKIVGNTLVAYKGNDSDVTIPDGITKIGESAFSFCYGLTSITIPNSVTSIGKYTFYHCESLKSITLPNSIKYIGDGAFDSCGLTSVTIPNSVKEIGYGAFKGCKSLKSIKIPNGVTHINGGAFSSCTSLKSIEIPDSVTFIDNWAFSFCDGLTSITIPNSVKEIGEGAFRWCHNVKSITIPNSVTSIGSGAFDCGNSKTDIQIPEKFKDEDTLKKIGFNDDQIDSLLDNYTWD